MRKTMVVLLVATVFGFGLLATPQAQAAETATITVTVTVQFLSVAVADGTLALATVLTGSETVTSADVQDVTNDGNVAETYTLQLTTTDVYTAGTTETSAGANTYVVQALFTADGAVTAPVAADFGADTGTADDVVLSASAQTASATTYAWTGSTDTGASVPATTVLDLYFKYSAPTSVTSGAEENLVATITATAA